MLKTISKIVLFILFIQCTSENERDESLSAYLIDPEPEFAINFIREQSFGSEDSIITGRMGGFAVDKMDRVFLVDGDQYMVHIFQSDGKYITSIGRGGDGPGEFISSPVPQVIENVLFLFDPMQFRLHSYSTDTFEFLQTQNLNPRNQSDIEDLAGYRPSKVFFRNNDRFVVLFSQTIQTDKNHPRYNADSLYDLYYMMDSDGTILSNQILKLKGRNFLSANVGGENKHSHFLFLGTSIATVSEDGYIYSGWSQDFFIEAMNSDGEYKRSYYYPFEKVPLTRDHALKSVESIPYPDAVEYLQSVIINSSNEDLPETWPALNDLLVDDENRLWVSTIVKDFDIYEWWVLENTGELITKFEWPRNEPIEVVKNGYIYTRETDEETGLHQVVRYRILFEEVN